MAPYKAAVFDLGGVLIHWDPRLLYRKMLPTDVEVEHFLSTVCTPEWNARQDAGRPIDQGIAELVSQFPDRTALIEAWRDRFAEMLAPMAESVDLLRQLHEREVPIYALSNWGAETFGVARNLFPFLEWFRRLYISGELGMMKPDPEIFGLLLREIELHAAEVVFIDDHPPNVESARRLGFQAVQFSSSQDLGDELVRLGLL